MARDNHPGPGLIFRGFSLRAQALVFLGGALLLGFLVYFATMSATIRSSLSDIQKEISCQRAVRLVYQLDQLAAQEMSSVRRAATQPGVFEEISQDHVPMLIDLLAKEPYGLEGALVLALDRHKNFLGATWGGPGGTLSAGLPPFVDAEMFRRSKITDRPSAPAMLLSVPGGLWIFTAAEVLRPDGSGPAAGWLVKGRLIGPHRLAALQTTSGAEVVTVGAPGGLQFAASGAPVAEVSSMALGQSRIYASADWARRVAPSELVIDIGNRPGETDSRFLVRIPSITSDAFIELRRTFVILTLFGGLVLIGLVVLVVEFLFLRRIGRIQRQFEVLSDSPDRSLRLDPTGSDELSRVSQAANRLLDGLSRRRGEIQTQQELLQSVLDSANEGIMAFRSVHGPDGGIEDFTMVVANRAAARLVGQPIESMVGRRLLDLYPGTLDMGLFDRWKRVVETGEPDQSEFFYGLDGLNAWYHSSSSKWKDGFVVTFEEISDRKSTEREMKENLEEIARFNSAMIGREERILEMKTEVNNLRHKLGLPPAYSIDSTTDGN